MEPTARLLDNLYAPCPPAGEGCHQWLFGAACTLLETYPDVTDDVAAVHLAAALNRPLQPREAIDAMAAARRSSGDDTPRRPRTPRPPVDARMITSVRVDPSKFRHGRGVMPRDVLLSLLCDGAPTTLVCVANDAPSARTRPLSGFTDAELGSAQFVVPAPMAALTGTTKAGRAGSPRCHDNVGERRWWVFDFDCGVTRSNDFAQAAAVLDRFGDRVGLIVQTRGKGVHAWVAVAGGDTVEAMTDDACRLGCDPTVIEDPVKLVRMPGGDRPGAGTQFILHYHPPVQKFPYKPGCDPDETSEPDTVDRWPGPF
jgi:hypothetical protein